MPEGVERVNATYCRDHLDGAFLAFAATDRAEVNDAVVADARAGKILVNRADADDELAGDFIVPASHRTENLAITVSAGSPALSAMIRDRLGQAIDPRWDKIAGLMRTLRPAIRRAHLDIAKRRLVFRDLATEEAIDILGNQGEDGLRRWLLQRHPELTHV
jgi:siroheme synthase-like protein